MLAIVIPFYKSSYIEETLDSLYYQSNKNFKVYIGNDGSSYSLKNLLESYDKNLKIIYKEFDTNLGGTSLTQQWERCIEMVKDETWVMILGDDDYISKNYVQEFYKHIRKIEERDINVIRFSSQLIYQNSKSKSHIYTHPRIEKSTNSFCRKFFENSRGSLSEHIFRISSYKKHGFRNFPLGWGADNFAWLDFSNFGNIYTINEALAIIRHSNENISRKGFQEEKKNQASLIYFSIIVGKYLRKFEVDKRLLLLSHFEKKIYQYKKFSLNAWIILAKGFLGEREFLLFLKFNRRFILKLLKI